MQFHARIRELRLEEFLVRRVERPADDEATAVRRAGVEPGSKRDVKAFPRLAPADEDRGEAGLFFPEVFQRPSTDPGRSRSDGGRAFLPQTPRRGTCGASSPRARAGSPPPRTPPPRARGSCCRRRASATGTRAGPVSSSPRRRRRTRGGCACSEPREETGCRAHARGDSCGSSLEASSARASTARPEPCNHASRAAVVIGVASIDAEHTVRNTPAGEGEGLRNPHVCGQLSFQARAAERDVNPVPGDLVDLVERGHADSRLADDVGEAVENVHDVDRHRGALGRLLGERTV